MRKFFVAAVVALFVLMSAAESFSDTYVRGYTRQDTYVAPHYRSSPDGSYNNNWSVRPNVNPHTGKRGTRSPTFNDRPPSNPYGLPSYRKRTITPYSPFGKR